MVPSLRKSKFINTFTVKVESLYISTSTMNMYYCSSFMEGNEILSGKLCSTAIKWGHINIKNIKEGLENSF